MIVDITIKVDGSQLMKFTAYFPVLNHTEELEIEIKQTEPPTEEFLTEEISKAKRIAKKVNANDVTETLDSFEEQLENEKGSADGKMKILDGRNRMLQLSMDKNIFYKKVVYVLLSVVISILIIILFALSFFTPSHI